MENPDLAENEATFKEKVTRLLRGGNQTVNEFREKIRNKRVVILLGSTKSGKSTLINHLIGTNLEAYDTGLTGMKIKERGVSRGPKIGRTSVSETSTPGVYPMPGVADTVISDSPGFDDNRGPVQNVISAIFINQVKYARSVKFVMVCDVSEIITDNINIFLNALKQTHKLLSSCLEIRPAVALIFTKVAQEETRHNLSNLLQRQVMNPEFRMCNYLVRNVVDNEDLIGLFEIPVDEGPIRSDLALTARSAIQKSQPIFMDDHHIEVALSDEANNSLLEIYPDYTDSNYFKNEINNVFKDFNDYFEEQWIYASFDEELGETKSSLHALEKSVTSQVDMRIERLSEIQASLGTLLGANVSESFANHFEFVTILDESCIMDDHYKEIIKQIYKKSLSELLSKIRSLLEKIQQEIEERKDNDMEFSSKQDLVAMTKCVARCLMSKATSVGSGVLNAVSEKVAQLTKNNKEGAVGAAAVAAFLVTDEAVIAGVEEAIRAALALIPEASAAGVVGLSGAAYVVYREIYGKRMEVRKRQRRTVY